MSGEVGDGPAGVDGQAKASGNVSDGRQFMDQGDSKDYEFSRRSMEEHWRAGYFPKSSSDQTAGTKPAVVCMILEHDSATAADQFASLACELMAARPQVLAIELKLQ